MGWYTLRITYGKEEGAGSYWSPNEDKLEPILRFEKASS